MRTDYVHKVLVKGCHEGCRKAGSHDRQNQIDECHVVSSNRWLTIREKALFDPCREMPTKNWEWILACDRGSKPTSSYMKELELTISNYYKFFLAFQLQNLCIRKNGSLFPAYFDERIILKIPCYFIFNTLLT